MDHNQNGHGSDQPKQGIGRGFIRNKKLRDPNVFEPRMQKNLEVRIKREPGSEPEPVPGPSSQPQLVSATSPRPQPVSGPSSRSGPTPGPSSQPESTPVRESKPFRVPDVGISASDILGFLNITGDRPTIKVTPRSSEIEAARNNGPNLKKTKTNETSEESKLSAEREQQAYIRRVNEQERRQASEFMFRPRGRNDDVKMEVDDEASSTCATLDGVSTCLDEINALLDPDFRSQAEQFFKSKKHQDYNDNPLPIGSKRKLIITQVNLNRIVIIKGTTGCGKTTQVPQYIMDDCYARGKHFNIVVTQPRRIAAKSIAERVCEERNWNVGELVGYQIGMDRNAGELTRLLYCTTGVLLQKLINEKKMDNYTHIIIDEVHERSDETDLLLMVVRKFLWTQAAPVKVILMSATFDSSKFSNYFTLKSQAGIPIRPFEVKIEEAVRPILKQYLNGFPPQWAEEAGAKAEESDWIESDYDDPHINHIRLRMCPVMIKYFETLDKSTARRGAVLVFLPGIDDIRHMTMMLEYFASKYNLNWLILPLHSSVTLEEQRRVFIPTRLGERKIILSTNIAESSITVPEVVYVIDFCLTKSLVCDKVTGYPTLKLEWASHANCDQRAGRCGRVQEGRVFRMVTSEFYQRYMKKEGVPELLRTPLDNSILKVKKLDLGPPKQLLALCIDSPNIADFRKSILKLKRVGALTTTLNGRYDDEDGALTFLGKIMADLPLDVHLSKLVMMGYLFDCLDDCIVIAACLSLQNFFEKSFDDTIRAYKARLAWSEKTFSDPISYWYAYRMFGEMVNAKIFEPRSEKARNWCKRNFVQYRRLQDVFNLVDELKKRLDSAGVHTEIRPNMVRDKFDDQLILKVVIAAAFYPYYFVLNPKPNPEIRKELNDKNPLNTVKLSGLPMHEGILYANQIKKQLAEIDTHMDLEFEDTHCYITFHAKDGEVLAPAVAAQTHGMAVTRTDDALYQSFDSNRRSFQENQVATSVYLAIKLKRNNIPITIVKYKNQVAEKRLRSLIDIRNGKIQAASLFNTHRFRIPSYRSCNIPEARLPPKFVKRIKILVTEIGEKGEFWAQMRNDQTKKMCIDLQNAYREAYQPARYPYNDPKVGDMILTSFEPGNNMLPEICRARVVRVERDKKRFQVYFIDFGGYGVVSYESFKSCVRLDPVAMPAELFTIPALAMECRLCEVKPNPGRILIQESRYSDMHTFRDLVSGRDDIFGMIYSVVNQVVSLHLFRQEDQDRSLNDILVEMGLFIKCEETALSKFDNEIRMNAHEPEGYKEPLYSLDECCEVEPIYEDNEEKYLDDRFVNSYQSPFTKEKIRLKGPYTPIEVEFAGVTCLDTNQKVLVDSESVNSIVFDPDPVNSNRRLLIASSVNTTLQRDKITIRNTTLMPDIAGFPDLMALLFSPRVEFRIQKNGFFYSGALCGLGYDEDSLNSYDKESDMELHFDCHIDNEDLAEINIIRYNINDILAKETNFAEISGQALFQKQQKIRDNVLKLLAKNRSFLPPRGRFKDTLKWVDMSQAPTASDLDHSIETLYYIHKIPVKVNFDDYKKFIADNLEKMKLIVTSNLRSTQAVECEICDDKYFNRMNLCDHLVSENHVELVKKIFEPERWSDFQVCNEYTV